MLESLATWRAPWLAVVDDERRVVGTVGVTDVVRAYRRVARETLAAAMMSGEDSGVLEVLVRASSPLVGRPLRAAGVPAGAFITSLERNGSIVAPTGDSVLDAGDRVTVIGERDVLAELGRLAGGVDTPGSDN